MKDRRNGKDGRNRLQVFSLLELLIVIAILGVLVTLVLPGFNGAQEDARLKTAQAEMKEIQTAFRRFAADVDLESNVSRMKDICNYGLWPLLQEEHPRGSAYDLSYSDYDVTTGLGRRGPYLSWEGQVVIATPGGDTSADEGLNPGQATVSSGTSIPVVKDTYGGYYRVLCPFLAATDDSTAAKLKKYRRLVLVCTGANGILDTTPDHLYTDGQLNLNHDTGEIEPSNRNDGNDDLIIRLLPTAAW